MFNAVTKRIARRQYSNLKFFFLQGFTLGVFSAKLSARGIATTRPFLRLGSTIFHDYMQISWLGYNAYRITSGGVTILLNPYDPASRFKIHKQAADVVVSSYAGSEVAQTVSGAPFIITQPGEYEIKSVFVHGVAASDNHTLYRLTVEDVTVGLIAATTIKELTNAQLEVLEGVDVTIIPVGGGPVASAKEAVTIINQMEPRIVVPSYHKIQGSSGLESVSGFLKEYSAAHETVDKLKIVKKDLPQEDTKVYVIQQA